jgi:hypothetical protein
MGPSPHTQVLYIPCAVHDHARDLSGQGGTLAARKKINTHAQGHAIFGFTPFEIARTHVYIRNFRFFRWPKKLSVTVGGGEGKKPKGDGRSIGQEEKREGAQPGRLARVDDTSSVLDIVLLTFIS